MRLWIPALVLAALAASQAKASPGVRTVASSEGRDLLRYYASIAEQETGIDGLATFLDAAAYTESRHNSTAINDSASESAAARRLFLADRNQRRYANNSAIGMPERWAYSGGWFGMMPATALATADGAAVTIVPESVFWPQHAIAYATDLVVRLKRNYGPDTWADIRKGWASPGLVNSTAERAMQTDTRFRRALRNTGHPESFADRRAPSTAHYPGFAALLARLQAHSQGVS